MNISIDSVDFTVNNIDPVIDSLISSSSTIDPGQTTDITVTAFDSNNDDLTYTWSTLEGVITGSGSVITYEPPQIAGSYSVNVEVSDGLTTVSDSIIINVNNTSPVITSVTATPETVNPGESILLEVSASDANGDTLAYTWKDSLDNVIGSGTSVDYTPPTISGTYTLYVTAQDGFNSTTDSTTVVVNNLLPIISSVTTSAERVEINTPITLTAVASDVNGDTLTYTWTDSGGTEVGIGSEILYTPTVSGTETLTVTVSDGQGGEVNDSVVVLVEEHVKYVDYDPASGKLPRAYSTRWSMDYGIIENDIWHCNPTNEIINVYAYHVYETSDYVYLRTRAQRLGGDDTDKSNVVGIIENGEFMVKLCLYADRVYLYGTGEYLLLDTSAFHDYELRVLNDLVELYVDGILSLTGTTTLSTTRMWVTLISNGSATVSSDVMIEYMDFGLIQ